VSGNIYDFPRQKSGGAGSGGGGGGVQLSWIDYVDAQDEKTRAQNDARFAEVRSGLNDVLAQLKILSDKVDDKPSLKWIIGVAFVGFLGVVSVLAFGGDRFDGGVQVQSALSERAIASARLAEENARQIGEILAVLSQIQNSDRAAD
jgi:hypothetical protein